MATPFMTAGPSAPHGLYDPRFEHDACGAGLVCNINGAVSRQIVEQGLEILGNLAHRGASGCDGDTGDGAGILIQMPDAFLRVVCKEAHIALPAYGQYASGLVFLPQDKARREVCRQRFETIVVQEGQQVLGWRRVPVNRAALGHLSRHTEPAIFQIFIGRDGDLPDQACFERKLFVIRRQVEQSLGKAGFYFHVPSLSSKTFVYKGMFLARQLGAYFADLGDGAMQSALALVHQRYSTNTFPAWDLAQPFRYVCHNGEINTLRGNLNWLKAREAMMASDRLGADLAKVLPVATPGASDSATLDAMLELLCHSGRSLPHAMMMLIPEAWQQHATMAPEKRAFYAYHAAMIEPWDGPATVPFTDGRWIGAVLDRNGLRPSRITITKDGLAVLASEAGVLDIAPERVQSKGRLQPGRMFLVDLKAGRLVADEEIKTRISRRKPYGQWVQEQQIVFNEALSPGAGYEPSVAFDPPTLKQWQQIFGYTQEDLRLLLAPMAEKGKEPLGSMGDDIPSAILSKRPRLLYDYFRQLFAQVTNPPLDAIREALVTSLDLFLGPEKNLLSETPAHCRRLKIASPILTARQLAALGENRLPGLPSAQLTMCFKAQGALVGLAQGMLDLCQAASAAVLAGAGVLILSDKGVDDQHAPIPALLAVAGVHHHLIRQGLRTRCDLVVESAEPREAHHFCCLLGYGAGAVHPYLALATLGDLVAGGRIGTVDAGQAKQNYVHAIEAGILKVMSKMGISTLQSYRGAQMFECLGLSEDVVRQYFTDTVTRIGGAGLDIMAQEVISRHQQGFPAQGPSHLTGLASGGKYQWRRDGESHQYHPKMLALFRQAVFNNDDGDWRVFSSQVNAQNCSEGLLRGLFTIKPGGRAIPLEAVEPWTAIVKRFKTGAMSYGSISQEAHETLAIAMNRLGARSNSGEGGEDPDRYTPDANGEWRNSAIKQVASGRFGVTGPYLVSAQELQIKMAQGAKPGEGGQLPGFKVYPWIAKTRHSTPYVGLISPPPHHDIYSIEDLSQLIYDLKCVNPQARVTVKLVSAAGVGTIAAGVVKGGAHTVLISGESGGTGASPLGAIRHCGMPWELGLPEAHQTLMMNGLRERVVLECDGQLKTGRDVAVACMLGAEEFGFGTLALVALGCIMMRVCHLNTCPVGIATQDPELRKKFSGRAEHVINLMRLIAEELRRIMADLGIRTVQEMVGRTDRLDFRPAIDHWKARGVRLSRVLRPPEVPPHILAHCAGGASASPETAFDQRLMAQAAPALETGRAVVIHLALRNIYRSVGTRLSGEIFRRCGADALADDTITLHCVGSAGQSFMAFGAKGMTVHVRGEANDYFGKGLSGARLIIAPEEAATFAAQDNVIVGNVALYGATSGEAYIRGVAGERFGVRNSGARAVVEGVGDHACEYMTGGRVVILGSTGRNAAAGMSGGIAYVLDGQGDFGRRRCNREMVDLEPVVAAEDVAELKALIEKHFEYTRSDVAQQVLDHWEAMLPKFVKVIPVEYKMALEKLGGVTQRLVFGSGCSA
jgi:glutamate synthase domain-containing protein 2/glutamate synthase domain-containing protein 1/glutamate synthase domain-containing protein 3